MNASPDRSAILEAERADMEKRLARAVADVTQEGHTITATFRNRGVPEARLRQALSDVGRKPIRHRQRRSRAQHGGAR